MEKYNPYSLEGKTIFVTGASSGIGKCTAIEASKLGATLVITARDELRLQETFNSLEGKDSREHKLIIADLTNEAQMSALLENLPQIDGVVLCAGKGLTLPIQFASRDKFDDIFNVNFFAPVELLRLLFKKKKLNKESSAVLLASLGGTQIFSGGNGIYGASKAALNTVMKFAAKEFASRKVRVNSICPGMVDTPLIHRGTVSEEQLEEDKKRYPLGRYGRPEDIAYAAIYLLSDASSWVTGQSMILDGGISIR
ncbi:NAD(P)-dependent dehydrogenase, short-chain alcohol dehydrogenase family [Fibrobacter sp. UWT3]|uniref:SDR family NAD(P)-dependent oxidoreductase n=1 Tax=Fibrobacter sp. UWT3 TaxID=1896225 RepID=UPI000BCE5208|nr:SDR family oxidoreductase [Fibrobacter sp. UWT3]SOE76595.1 NAD(P)-dependent dehydrogenase, short-chain alcohol dehydrogenase family [Fibrobacter sp. UWT3]